MVPADNQAIPELAFGFEHSFESYNMPTNLEGLMNQYKTVFSLILEDTRSSIEMISQFIIQSHSINQSQKDLFAKKFGLKRFNQDLTLIEKVIKKKDGEKLQKLLKKTRSIRLGVIAAKQA